MTAGEFQLARFVDAQAPVYDAVRSELAAGSKRSHWMWFIFPQLKALGRSATARHFGIEGRAEALAYAQHALLGPRLLECSEWVLGVHGRTASEIFGAVDALKLRSCMTLFDAVVAPPGPYAQVLQRYFDGRRDALTLERLR